MSKKVSNELFIERARSIHLNKYDYSKTLYTKRANKVIITCPVHGDFEQIAGDHLLGKGCRKCSYELRGQKLRISQEEFETRAREKWGNTYEYGKYTNMHLYIEVTCPKHGIFLVTPHNHLVDCGCPMCSESSGELLVRLLLDRLGVNYISQKRIKLPKSIKGITMYILDFVVNFNNKKYIIEYNGILHYEYTPHFHSKGVVDFEKLKFRDSLLRKLCKASNIELIEISYKLNNLEVIDILNNIFKNEI